MRGFLLVFGIVCLCVGAEILIVDKIIIHDFGMGQPRPEADRLIDLPDSAGYVLVALGIVSSMYFMALGRQRDK
jgi:hypothetical protein